MLFLVLAAAVTGAAAPNAVSVTVQGSIEASLQRAIGDDGAAVAAQVARLLRWRGDVVRNVHRGDVVTLLYESAEQQPELVALSYRGLEIDLHAYRFTDDDGVPRYYDGNGKLVEPKLRNSPVPAYVQITELVQSGRGKRRHHGIDLKAPVGTPVVMPFSGVVTRVNWSTRINGNCVEVDLGGGRLARFLHLDRVAAGVRPGARLAPGSAVGTVGNTGRSSAAHLHYEIRAADGRPLKPDELHGLATVHIDRGQLAQFDRVRFAFDRRLLEVESALTASGITPRRAPAAAAR